MTLKVHNTLSRALETFEPLEAGSRPAAPGAVPGSAGRVKAYACGPTVYGNAHVGNFRSFIVADLVHRYLEWIGYETRFVMNLTDVDDKTIDAAVREGVSLTTYTAPFAESFLRDAETLGMRSMDAHPKATEYVPRMIAFVEQLLEKGFAYVADDGSVYFSISAFPGYGKLSGMDLNQVRPGARVAVDEYSKDDARDFALWKSAKEKDEQAQAVWDSPWGRGRPGWHLECSVMGLTELGETLDLHLGGEDLVFPHHEDEIAQSEAVTGKPFARYWLHVKHLVVEGSKMSKSLGNTITVRDLLDQGFEPAAIRHQLLSAQYRRELNFTMEGLAGSARAVQRLLDFQSRLEQAPTSGGPLAAGVTESARKALASFASAMDADFNSADALAALFVFVAEVNVALDAAGGRLAEADRDEALAALASMDGVMGLIETAVRDRTLDEETTRWVESMIRERTEARKARDFRRADEIREELGRRGVVLEDGSGGTRWKVARRIA
jgi:cysteinyl-tRNA synthetase